MITIIRDYTLTDIISSMQYLLANASHSAELRSLAIQITDDKQDKIVAIYNFMKTEATYLPDPLGNNGQIELFISPVKLVEDYTKGIRPSGDCDDMALLTTAFYRSLSIPSHIVLVDCIGQGLDHAFCTVWSERLQQWIDIDPTTDYPLGWIHSHSKRILV